MEYIDMHAEFVQFCTAYGEDAKKIVGDALMTPEGARLIEALTKFRDIIGHGFHGDPRYQRQVAGQCEVISLLWRYGTATNSVPDTKPNQQHASEEKRD